MITNMMIFTTECFRGSYKSTEGPCHITCIFFDKVKFRRLKSRL